MKAHNTAPNQPKQFAFPDPAKETPKPSKLRALLDRRRQKRRNGETRELRVSRGGGKGFLRSFFVKRGHAKALPLPGETAPGGGWMPLDAAAQFVAKQAEQPIRAYLKTVSREVKAAEAEYQAGRKMIEELSYDAIREQIKRRKDGSVSVSEVSGLVTESREDLNRDRCAKRHAVKVAMRTTNARLLPVYTSVLEIIGAEAKRLATEREALEKKRNLEDGFSPEDYKPTPFLRGLQQLSWRFRELTPTGALQAPSQFFENLGIKL